MSYIRLLIGVAVLQGCGADQQKASVISIIDGDTLRVEVLGKKMSVRVACIDAPEMAQNPHGQKAKEYLEELLPVGSRLTIQAKKTDRYGRTVAELINESNVGLDMLSEGHAYAYREYLSDCNATMYLDAENYARQRRSGLWQVQGGTTRPWAFRRSQRQPRKLGRNTSGVSRYTCKGVGSYERAQKLLIEGHTNLDGNGDGVACESLRR